MDTLFSQVVRTKSLSGQIDVRDTDGTFSLFDLCYSKSVRCAVVTENKPFLEFATTRYILDRFGKHSCLAEDRLVILSLNESENSRQHVEAKIDGRFLGRGELSNQEKDLSRDIDFWRFGDQFDIDEIRSSPENCISLFAGENKVLQDQQIIELVPPLLSLWGGIHGMPCVHDLEQILQYVECIAYVQQGEWDTCHAGCVFWYLPAGRTAELIESSVEAVGEESDSDWPLLAPRVPHDRGG